MTIKEFKSFTDGYLNQIKLDETRIKRGMILNHGIKISEMKFLVSYIDTLLEGLHSQYNKEKKRKGIDNLYWNTLNELKDIQKHIDVVISIREKNKK